MTEKRDEAIKLKIMGYENRMKIVTALADEGYSVRCVEKDDPDNYASKLYFVEVKP